MNEALKDHLVNLLLRQLFEARDSRLRWLSYAQGLKRAREEELQAMEMIQDISALLIENDVLEIEYTDQDKEDIPLALYDGDEALFRKYWELREAEAKVAHERNKRNLGSYQEYAETPFSTWKELKAMLGESL